jgi:phosphoribosylcarboxyaminoimidazole (NCAIR) mutase
MIDRYTKVLLTVIAVALVAIVAQNAVGTLQAQNAQNAGISRVAICHRDDPNACARVTAHRSSGYTVLLTGAP